MAARKVTGKEAPPNRTTYTQRPGINFSTAPAEVSFNRVYLHQFQVAGLAVQTSRHVSRLGVVPVEFDPAFPAEGVAIMLATSGQVSGIVWHAGKPVSTSVCVSDPIW